MITLLKGADRARGWLITKPDFAEVSPCFCKLAPLGVNEIKPIKPSTMWYSANMYRPPLEAITIVTKNIYFWANLSYFQLVYLIWTS